MKLAAMDVIVKDVPQAAAFFRDVLGASVPEEFDRFAQVDLGAVQLMLSSDAMVPVDNARGVILHFEVDDVAAATAAAESRGAEVLLQPTSTDWGMQIAIIQGPEGLLIEFYCQVSVEPVG